jgi:hypothetical protein
VLLVLDPLRAEPVAEEAAAAAVALVETLRIGVLERVHARRHVLARRVNDQVEVVAHRAACVDVPAVAVRDDLQHAPELVVVGVVPEQVLEAGRVARDVVQPIGKARS